VKLKIAIIATVLATACSASSRSQNGENAGGEGSVTVFVTTEIKGQIEPCGCTSAPMGDLARTAALLAEARRGAAVVYLDAGSLLYTELPAKPSRNHQEQLKAELLADAFAESLQPSAVGLGPYDLAAGAARVTPPRQAANIAVEAGENLALEPPKVITAGGLRIGVFGVVDPELVRNLGVTATDPVAAARKAVGDLRGKNAQVIVGLLHMNTARARDLVGEVKGMSFAVVGAGAPEPDKLSAKPIRSGDTWLLTTANRGQVLARLDVTVRGTGAFTDAIGEARAKVEIESIDQRIERLRTDIAKYEADADGDDGFIARQKADLAELQTERDALVKSPLRTPAEGNWFVMTHVTIEKALACDTAIQRRKLAYTKAAGEANLAAAAGKTAPAPEPGKAGFVGTDECVLCHKKQVEFWKKTRHAQAWKTLVDVGKQYDLDCVYCHATGFEEPGGSTLASLAEPPEQGALLDVQCESCHGPGSIHVEEDGNEKPSSLVLETPRTRCIVCHNAQHSDTFDYKAYRRDVTGPGHGEKLRNALGDGPTGHELRSTALEKAGAAIGEGCLK
jgi:hypothetical protein